MIKLFTALALAFATFPAAAAPTVHFEDWDKPQPPFRIVGDIWYVGTRGLAAYLIRTPKGAILIDGTLAKNVPLIEANLATLGIKPADIRILLASHAHYDHAGGLAALKRDSGATMIATAADRWALEHGTARGDTKAPPTGYPPVVVDRTIADGAPVTLGGATLIARITPGHTPGCTTWTTTVVEQGRRLAVVFPCSTSLSDNLLVGNKAYPEIVADYRRSFALLSGMKADVVLPAHPEFGDVIGRHERGESFVAPGLLRAITADSESDFTRELAEEQQAAAKK